MLRTAVVDSKTVVDSEDKVVDSSVSVVLVDAVVVFGFGRGRGLEVVGLVVDVLSGDS